MIELKLISLTPILNMGKNCLELGHDQFRLKQRHSYYLARLEA